MRILTCMIIEDEPLAREILAHFIEKTDILQLIHCSGDGRDAWKHILSLSPDLVFLDVHLPEINGIDLLHSLSQPPKVIFTTAYADYAVKGFELDAIDYLVKPFSFQRFQKAIEKVKRHMEDQSYTRSLPEVITIKSDKKWVRVNCEEIIYIQSYGDYLKIITTEGKWVTKDTMKSMISQLPQDSFLRIHKSFVCNISFMEYMEGNQVKIKEEMLPIGATYKSNVWEVFGGKK